MDLNHRDIDFLDFVTHRLRGPLSNISWYAEFLVKGDLDDTERQQCLKELYKIDRHAIKLIDAFLNLSRLSKGVVHIDPVSVNLSDVISALINDFKPKFEGRGMALNFEEGEVSAKVDAEVLQVALGYILLGFLPYLSENSKTTINFEKHDGAASISIVSDDIEIVAGQELPQHLIETLTPNNWESIKSDSGLNFFVAKEILHTVGCELILQAEGDNNLVVTVLIPNKGMQKLSGQKELCHPLAGNFDI